jgi:hypothetical protein
MTLNNKGQFIKKVILFLLPLGFVFIFPISVYILSREYYSVEAVIKAQTANPDILYGMAYGSLGNDYKKQLLTKVNPELVISGNSRSVEFRQEFFLESNKFYNAGNGGMSTVESLNEIIKQSPLDNEIKFIIVSLDPGDFMSNHSLQKMPASDLNNGFSRFIYFLKNGWKQVYVDYLTHKFSFKELREKAKVGHIGLNAIINNDGYRLDGSYQYAKAAADTEHRSNLIIAINKQVESIRRRSDYSGYENEPSNSKLDSLNNILKLCREKHIYVLGFLAPRPTGVYREFISSDYPHKDVVKDLPIKLDKVFSANGFAFYDLSDSKLLGTSDNEFLDWVHGTDKLYLRITIYLAEKNEQLRKYVDLNKLKEMLKNTKGDFLDI